MSAPFFSYYQECVEAGGIAGPSNIATNIALVRTPDLSTAHTPLTEAFMLWANMEYGVFLSANQLYRMRGSSETVNTALDLNGHAPLTVDELLMAYRTAMFAEARKLAMVRQRLAVRRRRHSVALSFRAATRRRLILDSSDDEDDVLLITSNPQEGK